MPYDSFQIAAARAVTSYPDDVWRTLSPSERSAAIYRELRKLDAESIKGPKPTPPGREDNEMNKAEETVKHAIRNAMTSTSGNTGLRAGAACDRLVDAIVASLLDSLVNRAVRDLALAKVEA